MFSRGLDRVIDPDFNPLGTVIEQIRGPVEGVVGGRDTLLFGSNSYLGLNFHPECIEAAVAATRSSGTGSTASRAAGGNYRQHVILEERLAAFHRKKHAVVFSTGFMANLGVISGITRPGDAIFLDGHCHASIVDAARMSGAHVSVFRHNDAEHLDELFEEVDVPSERVLVVVEGLYSVWGDVADLANLLSIAKRRGAVTLVDEAHGVGVYGAGGRGVAELAGVEHLADLVTGTFSKSLGVLGGYCVTDLDQLRSLRVMARPYLYTASLPPALIASALKALELIASSPQLREAVWRNAQQLRAGLNALGLPVVAGDGPIGSIRMASVKAGLLCWQGLLDRGIYVNVLVPPAAPDGESVLRFSVSAAHSPAQIQRALTAISEVCHL